MSKAEDLLNSLAEEEKGAVYTVSSNEPHIVVGLDRFITVPDQIKKIGVQYDHDIETITFDCPRFWDGNDLSTMKIYINYMREDGHVGMYLCDIVSIEDDIMHFDWTISGEVTQIKGTISFLVCIKRVDSDGNEERHWNSELCQDLYVSEGMECQESILYRYPDIITQLLTRMDITEFNTSKEEILNRINEAFDTNDTVNQTIKDKTVDYLESEITSKDLIVELPVGKWTKQYDNEYTQTVVIDGVDASINPIVSLFYSGEEATDDELNAYTCLSEVTTLDNAIKFVAIEKPSITFSVIVKGLTGVLLSDSIRLLISDKWSASKGYKHGDYCIYNDALWRFDSFGSEAEFVIKTPPGELMNWVAVNVGEELSKLCGISIIADKFSSSKEYHDLDYCIFDDSLWRCDIGENNSTSDAPSDSSTIWTKINVSDILSAHAKNINMLLYNINKMKQNFQDGVDSVYNAIVSAGTTPSSKSLSDVVTGIGNMSTNRYNTGYNDGVVAGGNVGYSDGYNAGKTDYNPTNATLDNNGSLTVTNSSGVTRLTKNFSNSYSNGFHDGYEDGHNDGYEEGHTIGWRDAKLQFKPVKIQEDGNNWTAYNENGEAIYTEIRGI